MPSKAQDTTTLNASAGFAAFGRFFKGDFARHSIAVFAATMLANLMNYLFRFLAARYVTIAEYGELSALLAFVNLSLAPALILAVAVTKYSSLFHALNEIGSLKSLKHLVFKFGAACSIGLLCGGTLASPALAHYLHLRNALAVVAASAVVAVYFVVPSLWSLLQGAQKFYVYAFVVALDGVLKVSLGLMAIFAGYSLAGVLFWYASGGLISLIVAVCLLIRDDRRVASAPIKFDFARLWQTISGATATTLAIALLSSIDLVLVQHFFRPSAVGLYAAANICGKSLLFVVSFLPSVVLPKAAYLTSKGESPRPVLIYALSISTSASAVILLVYLTASTNVITFFASAKYAAGSVYVFQYGIAMFLLACVNLVASYRMGIHDFGYVAPLCVVTVGEVVAMGFFGHDSLDRMIETMVVGNSIALICLLSGVIFHESRMRKHPEVGSPLDEPRA